MSNTPSEGQQTAYQFQFQHPIQYPMSQAQVNYAQQPVGQSQATTSTTTTNQPTATSTTTYQTANTNQTTTQGSTSLGATSSATTLPGSTQQSTSSTSVPQSRSAAELARKDRTLADFMLMLDDHEPLIPNEVTDYYLQRVGFECEDIRLKRLLALAAQKFVSDIAADAFQHARIRTNAAASGRGRAPLGQSSRDKTRTTLTMEDLSNALFEYGIIARKPDFYM